MYQYFMAWTIVLWFTGQGRSRYVMAGRVRKRIIVVWLVQFCHRITGQGRDRYLMVDRVRKRILSLWRGWGIGALHIMVRYRYLD